ncbi:Uncharacterised protein [Mycobacteroides abscessus]|nr:Uncharacterised protein [Mycobacteroides abscessus]
MRSAAPVPHVRPSLVSDRSKSSVPPSCSAATSSHAAVCATPSTSRPAT